MLSKNNKILIGCLALLLVMSVGYALFSDTITVTGTATAKGEFNITPTCIAGSVLDLGIEEHGYNNEYCNADDATDTVSFGANFDYPGAGRVFTIKFTNTGSMNSTMPLSLELSNGKFCIADSLDKDAETQGECQTLTPNYSNNLLGYAVQVADGEIYNASNPSTLPVDVQLAFSENGEYVLKPGNSIYFYAYLSGTDVTATNNVLNQYINVSYNAAFEQLTN